MTRNRKIEKEIKSSFDAKPIGTDVSDLTLEQVIDQYTNEGSTRFCPFIDHNKLAKNLLHPVNDGVMHRDYALTFPCEHDWINGNKKDERYHWVQLGFKSYQFCKHQRDPVPMEPEHWDRCQCNFKKCTTYQANQKKK